MFRNSGPEGSSKGNVDIGFQLVLQVRPWLVNVLILNELCCSFHIPVFSSPFSDDRFFFVGACRTGSIVFLLGKLVNCLLLFFHFF